MKLSLAFVALTAAADSQAPVISLNLAADTPSSYAARHTKDHAITNFASASAATAARHDKGAAVKAQAQNSFADECEVPQNTEAGKCQEPMASAYDHHDGDISTSIQTVYTLFVKSEVRKNPVKAEQAATSINLNMRGEWVITYDVKDVAGNAAEQVQFALIMIDTVAPVFDNAPSTITGTKCTDYTTCSAVTATTDAAIATQGYISKGASGDNIDVELCGATDSKYFYFIANGEGLTSTDKYDGDLDQSNSIMDFKIDGTSKTSESYSPTADGFDKPADTFSKNAAGKFVSKDYTYSIYTADFADIFGSSNANNVHTESGTVTVEDTIKPTIKTDDYTYADTWECGYNAFDYRASSKDKQYSDCFDDTISTDATHGSAQIYIACTEDNTSGLIDEVNSYTYDSPAKAGTPSAAQKKCLGLEGIGKGTAHANAAGAYNAGAEDVVEGNANQVGFMDSVTLTYKLQDTFGNQADDVTRTVKISDTIAPTLYITQSSIRTTNYVGGKDANTCTGDECKCIHTEGGYSNTDGTGDYTTEHCVQNHHTDENGVTTATRVHDQLGAAGDVGANGKGVSEGSAYNDELTIQHSAGYAQDYKYVQELMEEGNGFGCYDICSSTTTKVRWETSCASGAAGSEFNMLKPGTYYLKYECNDQAQNKATACRTFVNVDKTRPVITVLQAANTNDNLWTVEASRDNNYVDAGATCSDMVDGNISQDVEVSGDVVNMAAVGTYKINYNCEDSAGQTAVQATRTVVVQDNTCPTCTVPGGTSQITVEASFPYTEEQSTCTDTLDGAMPNAHVYGTVNVEQTGTYVLTYSVTDKNGNGDGRTCKAASGAKTDHFTKTVIVEDTMIPIISLKYRGTNLVGMMAEQSTTTVNGWVIGAVASAVSGVALLGYAATRKATVATSVPV